MTKYTATVRLHDDHRTAEIVARDAGNEQVFSADFPLNISPRNAVMILADHHNIDVYWAPVLEEV